MYEELSVDLILSEEMFQNPYSNAIPKYLQIKCGGSNYYIDFKNKGPVEFDNYKDKFTENQEVHCESFQTRRWTNEKTEKLKKGTLYCASEYVPSSAPISIAKDKTYINFEYYMSLQPEYFGLNYDTGSCDNLSYNLWCYMNNNEEKSILSMSKKSKISLRDAGVTKSSKDYDVFMEPNIREYTIRKFWDKESLKGNIDQLPDKLTFKNGMGKPVIINGEELKLTKQDVADIVFAREDGENLSPKNWDIYCEGNEQEEQEQEQRGKYILWKKTLTTNYDFYEIQENQPEGFSKFYINSRNIDFNDGNLYPDNLAFFNKKIEAKKWKVIKEFTGKEMIMTPETMEIGFINKNDSMGNTYTTELKKIEGNDRKFKGVVTVPQDWEWGENIDVKEPFAFVTGNDTSLEEDPFRPGKRHNTYRLIKSFEGIRDKGYEGVVTLKNKEEEKSAGMKVECQVNWIGDEGCEMNRPDIFVDISSSRELQCSYRFPMMANDFEGNEWKKNEIHFPYNMWDSGYVDVDATDVPGYTKEIKLEFKKGTEMVNNSSMNRNQIAPRISFPDVEFDLSNPLKKIVITYTTSDKSDPEKPDPTDPTTPEKPDPTDPTTPEKPDPTDPTTPEKPDPTDPTTPEKPDPTDPTTPEKPDPTEPTTPEKPDPTEPTTPEKPDLTDPTIPIIPEKPDKPEPNIPIDPKNPVDSQKIQDSTSKDRIKTGDKGAAPYGIIGIGATILFIILGLVRKKKIDS